MSDGSHSLMNQSKSTLVYRTLRQRILDAELPPAAPINQEQLALELGVSTTPLREALRRLESEGLVTLMAHREAVVAPLDADELVSIYEVREELDPLAAALAAERHTDAEADTIRQATKHMRRPGRSDRMSVNRGYHAAIYRACHNEALVEVLEGLWNRSDRYRRAVGFMALDDSIIAEHEAIASAVLERRADDAAALMRTHIARTRAAFTQTHAST